MVGEIVGFLSYVQADDGADGGRILSLAKKVRAEYRLQTGDEISIFVDRESLEWGSEWEQRINEAIAGTTFFIPIITPSYFRSQSCRKELMKFAREAKRIDLEQLLMPVYWVTVSELENDPAASADEAITLVARYQREDFRETRLEDEGSALFRKAVARLASELANRSAKVTNIVGQATATTLVLASSAIKEDESEPGWLEVMAAGEDASPELNSILENFGVEITGVAAIISAATDRLNAADASNDSMKSRLAIAELLARNLQEPAARIEQLGHNYVSTLAALDPAIHALLDVVGTNVEQLDEQAEFLKTIRALAKTAEEALRSLEGMVQELINAAKFSRSLRVPLKRMRTGLQGIFDGRELIEEWGRRAAEIEARKVHGTN